MNTSQIKSYAPKARRDFIQVVTARANMLGLSESKIIPAEIKGEIAIIEGRAYPKSIAGSREKIIERINSEGFINVIEKTAYTWFNRIVALRYMELHDYLDHGYRALSNRADSDIPEILEKATEIELPGLNKDKVIELRLAGNKDNELYRMLLVAQCNALHKAMHFLFEHIYDETELLLPDNLLHSDSIIRKLVNEIDDDAWNEVEIIGWLYQFYISEKKKQVIGKVVKSEDIPAATQLFTPNWIVKYMVQNTLGRMWMATYPESSLKEKMEYYIEPAEQEPEVQKQLDEITPKELNPEELTFLDPACGSGHILVEAYDLFKEIYLERGYRTRDIPELILKKNLYGIDIDDRAAQLAGFAILMKARNDDRRIFERDNIKLNVISIIGSDELESNNVINIELEKDGIKTNSLSELIGSFKNAKTFGSLITVPETVTDTLDDNKALIEKVIAANPMYNETGEFLLNLIQQTEFLSKKYDCVITNPPYMGSKAFNDILKKFAIDNFSDSKSDLFAMFIKRGFGFAKLKGFSSMVTMQSWMFLSSYEKLRENILDSKTMKCMVHMANNVMRIAFGTSACVWQNSKFDKYNASFSYVNNDDLNGSGVPFQFPVQNDRLKSMQIDDFKKIPGSPIVYWLSGSVFDVFSTAIGEVRDFAEAEGKNVTTDNARFIRYWCGVRNYEVGRLPKRWFSFAKGGPYRKWFGNELDVVDWSSGALDYYRREPAGRLIRPEYWYLKGITWSKVTSSRPSFRLLESDQAYQEVAILFTEENDQQLMPLLGLLNSIVAESILAAIAPTLNYQLDDICRVPRMPLHWQEKIAERVDWLVHLARSDSNSVELALNFQSLPILTVSTDSTPTLESRYTAWINQNRNIIAEMKRLEAENNRIFIDAYGLQDELTPDVPIEQITLTVNPAYRYGDNLTEEKQWTRFRQNTIEELISYSIGCLMGRYSLDAPGLIYAHSGNESFDHSRYKTFPADDDGIVPVSDIDWFEDDATNRFVEFMKVAWSEDTLDENLNFVAESVGQKTGEPSIDSIRRYISTDFYKDHLKTYKKTPIYWFFSSGKLKAFECLIYLHRYNESTLARMRSAYVTPLHGKLNARMEHLRNEIEVETTTSAKKKLEKQLELFKKKHEELVKFDDELRHYADMRIKLDLDDGVKVNYGKFGNLLAEKKAVVGKEKK